MSTDLSIISVSSTLSSATIHFSIAFNRRKVKSVYAALSPYMSEKNWIAERQGRTFVLKPKDGYKAVLFDFAASPDYTVDLGPSEIAGKIADKLPHLRSIEEWVYYPQMDAAKINGMIQEFKKHSESAHGASNLGIAMQTAIEIGEWALLRGPSLIDLGSNNSLEVETTRASETLRPPLISEMETSSKSIRKSDLKKQLELVGVLTPEKYFQWFDKQLDKRGRIELQKIMKHWVSQQVGKHDFAELTPELAIAEKHKIARGIQLRLDQIGLKILCQHVGRNSESKCGDVGRLNADLTGSSSSGQYLVLHNSSTGGKGSHMRCKGFPCLMLVSWSVALPSR